MGEAGGGALPEDGGVRGRRGFWCSGASRACGARAARRCGVGGVPAWRVARVRSRGERGVRDGCGRGAGVCGGIAARGGCSSDRVELLPGVAGSFGSAPGADRSCDGGAGALVERGLRGGGGSGLSGAGVAFASFAGVQRSWACARCARGVWLPGRGGGADRSRGVDRDGWVGWRRGFAAFVRGLCEVS